MQQKADARDIRVRCVPGEYYRVCTLDSPPIWSLGFALLRKMFFRAFHRTKMSC